MFSAKQTLINCCFLDLASPSCSLCIFCRTFELSGKALWSGYINGLWLQPFLFLRCLQCRGWQGWTAQNCQRHFLHVLVHPSYSPSSSSNSPSSSAVASWYCWYSETKSFMLDSASVNSISSIPSPVYQCKKASQGNKDAKKCVGKATIASPRLTSSKTLARSCLAAEHGSEVFLSWVDRWKKMTFMLLLSLCL